MATRIQHPARNRRKIERFSRLTLWGRRWFWRGRGANGEIVIPLSEPYASAQARDAGIVAAREIMTVGTIVDL